MSARLKLRSTQPRCERRLAEQLRFRDHLADLKDERKSCPGYSDAEIAAQQMRELMRLAAWGALKFFTMGMAP